MGEAFWVGGSTKFKKHVRPKTYIRTLEKLVALQRILPQGAHRRHKLPETTSQQSLVRSPSLGSWQEHDPSTRCYYKALTVEAPELQGRYRDWRIL